MEISEVGIYFDDPVWLHEDHGANEYDARWSREKRLDLHPGNDVVEGPGHVEKDCADGQPPRVYWVMKENPEAMPDAEEELEQNELVKYHASSHVGHGNTRHDDERSNHVALSPSLKNEPIWISRPLDETLLEGEARTGSRDEAHSNFGATAEAIVLKCEHYSSGKSIRHDERSAAGDSRTARRLMRESKICIRSLEGPEFAVGRYSFVLGRHACLELSRVLRIARVTRGRKSANPARVLGTTVSDRPVSDARASLPQPTATPTAI